MYQIHMNIQIVQHSALMAYTLVHKINRPTFYLKTTGKQLSRPHADPDLATYAYVCI